jgi:hypothetical protein
MDRVELHVTPETSANELAIHFDLVNSRDSEIYVVDVSFHISDEGVKPESARPEVSFVAPATVILSSCLRPLPQNAAWTTPPSVYASRVEAHQTYSNTLRAALPLRHDTAPPSLPPGSPGAPTAPPTSRQVQCAQLRFELGVIAASPELGAEEQLVGGQRLWHLRIAALRHHEILTSDHRNVSLPLVIVS